MGLTECFCYDGFEPWMMAKPSSLGRIEFHLIKGSDGLSAYVGI